MIFSKKNLSVFGIAVAVFIFIFVALFVFNNVELSDTLGEPVIRTQEEFKTLTEASNNLDVFIPVATQTQDGIHYTGGELVDTFTWGPNLFSVGADGIVSLNDGAASREIFVNSNGEVIGSETYKRGHGPIGNSAKDYQLTSDQEDIYKRLQIEIKSQGFGNLPSEVFFWGTSSEGVQYWQVNELFQNEEGLTRVRTYIYALNSIGEQMAFIEIPTDEYQYVPVEDMGVFVDVDQNQVYYMRTTSDGVRIRSTDWIFE